MLSCGVAFILYEYLITFDLEVQLFWKRQLTGAGILFLLNRYLLLTNVLFAISPALPQVSHVMDVYGTVLLTHIVQV